jgi:hypothetical protein
MDPVFGTILVVGFLLWLFWPPKKRNDPPSFTVTSMSSDDFVKAFVDDKPRSKSDDGGYPY